MKVLHLQATSPRNFRMSTSIVTWTHGRSQFVATGHFGARLLYVQ